MNNDITLLRELARQYAEIATLPIQEERRKLWADHFSLKPAPVPVLAQFGMWNVWCRDVFGDANMKCADPFYREYERRFRMMLFQHDTGDDTIQEPWIGLHVPFKGLENGLWGVDESLHNPGGKPGSAGCYNPSVKTWDDVSKIHPAPHELDEEAGQRNLDKLASAIGDILAIDVQRAPVFSDISTSVTRMRGLEQLMLDMHDSPRELRALLALMRDALLENLQKGENAGHFTLTSSMNQQPSYSREFEWMKPNSGPRKRKDLWGLCAAQEFALVSPEFHDEFMFQYQLPILSQYGLTHYGCCEDLTEKITMLRQLKNLRSVTVAPLANVRRCAEQIGRDYAMSWRPNPTDMVCCGYNEERVEKIIRKGLDDAKGCVIHIHLKDIETLEGDNTRLKRWVAKVRQCVP